MASSDFNGTNGDPIETFDSNWGLTSNSSGDGCEIQSNICRSSSPWNNNYYRYTTGDPDLSEIVVKANTEQDRGAACRMPTDERGYECRVRNNGTELYTIILQKNGTYQASSTINYSDSVDRTLKCTTSGTSSVDWRGYIDDTEEVSYTDSTSPLSGGLSGFCMTGNGTTTDSDIDDWTDGAGGGTPVSQTFVTPFEALQSVSAGKTGNVEALQSVSAGKTGNVETLQTITQSYAGTIEALQSVAQSTTVPFECRGNALVSAEFITPLEAGQSISAGLLVNIESLQSVAQSTAVPIEALQRVAQGLTLNIESVGRVSVDINGHLEVLAHVSRESLGAFESLQTVAGSASLNIEACRTIASATGINFEALLGSGLNVIVNVVDATATFTVQLDRTLVFGDVFDADLTFADVIDRTITFH